MSQQDYKAAFKSLCADMGAITALLGLDGYSGVDPVLRAITDLIASRPAADESAKPAEDRLRRLIGTVNAYEKATGVGGWYAENIQEQCNALLKAIGSTVRFGLGSENPIESDPATVASKEAVTLSDLSERSFDLIDKQISYVAELARRDGAAADKTGQFDIAYERLRTMIRGKLAQCDSSKEAVLSDEELALFAQTDDEFADCNETSTDYATLMRWANLGLLECEHFTVTDAGRTLLAQRDASKAEPTS